MFCLCFYTKHLPCIFLHPLYFALFGSVPFAISSSFLMFLGKEENTALYKMLGEEIN